jgi:hypothetical protein
VDLFLGGESGGMGRRQPPSPWKGS